MRENRSRALPAVIFLLAGAPTSAAQDSTELDPIRVQDEISPLQQPRPVDPQAETGADAAGLMTDAPGGHMADNGPVSSQVQYRGLFGPRMNVQLDGMPMTPGGPNWMDPPLHYLPPGQVESLELMRGIAPVSSGAQTLGGTVRARARQSRFTESHRFRSGGRVGLTGRSMNAGGSVDAFAQTANRNHRLHLGAVHDQGEDEDFGEGKIAASEHERDQGRIGYGLRGQGGRVGLDYSRTETGDSGNPSLPLDIKFFETDIAHLTYGHEWGKVKLDASVGAQAVDHEMTNYRLRPAPDFNPMMPGPDRRRVEATGDSATADLDLSWPAFGGRWSAGLDLYGSRHQQDIFDPDNSSFFVTQFNDAEKRRLSGFTEWGGPLGEPWEGRFGLRVTRVTTEAGVVDLAPGLPQPAQNLRSGFNDRDREVSDLNTDAVWQLARNLSESTSVQLGLGRKTRSPSHIERYLWLPLEVSAGLGDGNNYVGNPGLEPEVSREINLGLDWTAGDDYLRPQFYFRDLRDYIAGTPVDGTPKTIDSDVERVSNVNGDATPRQYNNINAEMYGLDLEWRYTLTPQWHLDGLISAVRGERDSGDPLFRLPADTAVTGLNWSHAEWSLRLESELYARQTRISRTLVETEPSTSSTQTPGYGLVNLAVRWRRGDGLALRAGVDNIFDKKYRVHTRGFNRVSSSDVSTGERLPGQGRNLYVHLGWSW
jgi:iron complex outermembrane receptor protein